MRVAQRPIAAFHAATPRGWFRQRRGRKAAVLVAVLVCVGIAGLLMLGMLRQMMAQRAQVDLAGLTLQARWLAEGAVERAAARLAADPGYQGEIWHVSAADLGGAEQSAVQIQVQRVEGLAGHRQVRIQADYPDNPVHRVRITKETIVEIPLKTASQR